MSRLRVSTVVGTRPEIIRLSRVIAQLDQYCDHLLVHTGQNYDFELNEIFFEDLGIRRPDVYLDAVVGTAAETVGNIIAKFDRVLASHPLDAVLVLGDTNSCLSVLAAKRRKIPIFHMEAGNRCFDMRVPEEINRRIVDHLADINLPYSSIAREYLLREGIAPDRIIKTGSPMWEVLDYYGEGIRKSDVCQRLALNESHFCLVSAHREENIETDDNFQKLVSLINFIAGRYPEPVIVSAHPRTRKKIEQENITFATNVRLMKPFGFFDYVHLQTRARFVFSDSGTITEEASILNLRAINIREAHERPEGMEEGVAILTGLNVDRVHQAMKIIEGQSLDSQRLSRLVADYTMPNVSEKIVRIIYSYTDYVKRTVWGC